MKVIRIISEHKQKKSRGKFEVIVKMDDGRLVTRHMPLSAAQKQEAA